MNAFCQYSTILKKCVLLIAQLLQLLGRLGTRKPHHRMNVDTPTDRLIARRVLICCVIEVFECVLSFLLVEGNLSDLFHFCLYLHYSPSMCYICSIKLFNSFIKYFYDLIHGGFMLCRLEQTSLIADFHQDCALDK